MTLPAVPTIGILIFDQVEVLDFCGPFEVFSAARAIGGDDHDPPCFRVVTIAATPEIVRARGGLKIEPEASFADHPPLDILLVPGGWGTRAAERDDALMAWIDAQAKSVSILASVCTGALLLAKLGHLDGHRATTHWTALDRMEQAYPAITTQRNVRFVDEETLITSAGISAGIDMSLHLVARICGEDIAKQTAAEMEYDWKPQ